MFQQLCRPICFPLSRLAQLEILFLEVANIATLDASLVKAWALFILIAPLPQK